MAFTVNIDNNKKYIVIKLSGDLTEADVQQFITSLKDHVTVAKVTINPVSAVADITELNNVTSEARKAVVGSIGTIGLEKMAVIGKHGSVGAVAELIITASGKGNQVQFFNDIAAAEKWIGVEQ